MLRVFHVPSHLTYVAKLAGPEFGPVSSPVMRPLRMGELAALGFWDFFDVVHIHTVELATDDDIERVALRAGRESKRLVFTAHDLVPNIEADRAAFDRKTALVGRHAAALATLTKTAARDVARRAGVPESAVRVVPHGAALPLPLVGSDVVGEGVAVFGALRPNRDLVALARAWRTLPKPRPPLRVLVRSLAKAERERYESVLAELEQVRRAEPALTITTAHGMVASDVLAFWCQRSAVLALPYRRITHSGQLELARDLGLRVLAPDVPTLREQLADGPSCSTIWFPPQMLDQPQRFADYLRHALSLPPPARNHHELRAYRAAEHQRLLDTHHKLYFQKLRPEKM